MRIIFDLDGTLFETAYSITKALDKLFEEIHIEKLPMELVESAIGCRTMDFLKIVLPEKIKPIDVSKRFRELEQIEVVKNGRLFEGIMDMVKQLKNDGYSLIICSNGSLEYIELVLNTTGISEYFDDIFSASMFESKTIALKSCLDSNGNSVMIGDTMSDFNASMVNEIPSIAASYGYGKMTDYSKATFAVNQPLEIVPIINQIDVFSKISKMLLKNKSRIIGVNGVDTSGKTMFSMNFSRYLNSIGVKTQILHIDDFHNPSAIRTQGENEIDAYLKNAFNYNQLTTEILAPIKAGEVVNKDVLCLNLDSDNYDKLVHYTIDDDTVLIIEGVLLFRSPLLQYMDTKIYLHISFEEVLNRANIRDVPKYGESFLSKYKNKYIPLQKRYIEECCPEKIADVVVNNENFDKPIIDVMK